MSRYFLAPIKNPTWKDFINRVGGIFAIFLIAILIAKFFFPGSETTAILIVGTAAIGVLVVQTVRHRQSAKKIKRRNKRK